MSAHLDRPVAHPTAGERETDGAYVAHVVWASRVCQAQDREVPTG